MSDRTALDTGVAGVRSEAVRPPARDGAIPPMAEAFPGVGGVRVKSGVSRQQWHRTAMAAVMIAMSTVWALSLVVRFVVRVGW